MKQRESADNVSAFSTTIVSADWFFSGIFLKICGAPSRPVKESGQLKKFRTLQKPHPSPVVTGSNNVSWTVLEVVLTLFYLSSESVSSTTRT